MATKVNVAVNIGDLTDAADDVKSRFNSLGYENISKVGSYSRLKVDVSINTAVDLLKNALKFEKKGVNALCSELKSLDKTLEEWDKANNDVGTEKETAKSTGKKKTTGKKKKAKNKTKTIKSVLSSVGPVVATNTAAVVKPTVNAINKIIKQFKRYLKEGDVVSAAALYEVLKTLGKKKKAKQILAKYGYTVKKKNGEYVVKKKKKKVTTSDKPSTDDSGSEDPKPSDPTPNDPGSEDPKPNDPTPDDPAPNEPGSDDDTDVVAPEEPSSDNPVVDEPTIDVSSPVVDNGGEQPVVTTTDNNISTNNSNYNNNYSNNNQVVTNTATEVPVGETPTTPSVEVPVVPEEPVEIEPTTKPSVVTVTEDPQPKKSGGLGVAVPIGLGTIATGAAAVAGVRYFKNKKEDALEYDEDYDDENNNLGTDGEYIDSAEYDSGSDYTSDEYLGPEGSTYTDIEDSYIDSEELEEQISDSFSDDSVLNELNSNY